jgi:hypothetical protein
MRAATPSFAKTSGLVARALGMSAEQLHASFRPATTADLPAILDVRRRVIGDQLRWDDERYLRWRYDFEGRRRGRNRCLVVAQNGRLMGFIGTEDVWLVRGEDALPALSLMDIMLDPALDGSGLGIWLNMAVFDRHPHVIEIGANPNSIGLIRRLYRILAIRNHFVSPVNLGRYVRTRLKLGAASTLLAGPVNLGVRTMMWATSRRAPYTWGFAPIRRFDESVHDLFDRRWNPAEVTFARTSSYLNWRLFENPRAIYEVMGAYRSGRLIGYMAFQVTTRYDGLSELGVVDWLVDAEYGARAFRQLLLRGRAEALRRNLDLMSVTPLHRASERLLPALGFIRQTHEFNTVGVRFREPLAWPELHDPSRWFLTEANTDRDGLAGGPSE